MAIYLQEIRFSDSPLQLIRDAVFLLPADQPLAIRNSCPLKIIYLLAGHAALSIDNGPPVELHPGDTQIIVGPRLQEYRPLPGGESCLHTIILQFREPPTGQSPPTLHHYLYDTFPESTKIPSGKSALLWNCMAQLRAENEERPHLWHNVVHHLVEEAVLQIAVLQGSHPARYRCPQQLALSHYFGPLLEKLSKATQPSHHPHTLTLPPPASAAAEEASQRLLGMSTGSLHRKMQIESAKLQLVRSSQTMQVIAKRAGFGSLATFYRSFTKAQGTTPANYRKRFQLSDPQAPFPQQEPPPRPPGSPKWKILRPASDLTLECAGVLFLLDGELTLEAEAAALRLETERPIIIPAAGRFPAKSGNALAAWVPVGQNAPGFQPALLPPIIPAQADFLRETLQLPAPTLHQRLSVQALTSLLWITGLRQDRRAHLKTAGPYDPLPVAHAKEYIRKNYAQRIKLRKIAWAAGVSEEHLARQFQQAYGQTVMNYLKRHRLQESARLLSSTELPLDEIARQTGFSTTGLLFRAFKAHAKCTPGRWRQMQQKNFTPQ